MYRELILYSHCAVRLSVSRTTRGPRALFVRGRPDGVIIARRRGVKLVARCAECGPPPIRLAKNLWTTVGPLPAMSLAPSCSFHGVAPCFRPILCACATRLPDTGTAVSHSRPLLVQDSPSYTRTGITSGRVRLGLAVKIWGLQLDVDHQHEQYTYVRTYVRTRTHVR